MKEKNGYPEKHIRAVENWKGEASLPTLQDTPPSWTHNQVGGYKFDSDLMSKSEESKGVKKKKKAIFYVGVTYRSIHSSQKYINKAVYYHIPQQEKLIRQGPAKAETSHKKRTEQHVSQMGHYSLGRWLC